MIRAGGAFIFTNTRLEVIMEPVTLVTAAHRAVGVVLTVMRTTAIVSLTAVHNLHLNP